MSVATNAAKVGWLMSGSPALKIVRHPKLTGDVPNGPPLAGGYQSNAKPTVAANEPPMFTMTAVELARELRLLAKLMRRRNDQDTGLLRLHRLPGVVGKLRFWEPAASTRQGEWQLHRQTGRHGGEFLRPIFGVYHRYAIQQ